MDLRAGPRGHAARISEPVSGASHEPQGSTPRLAPAAVGVVYGDTGAPPLYAMDQLFHDGVSRAADHVLGGVSLVIRNAVNAGMRNTNTIRIPEFKSHSAGRGTPGNWRCRRSWGRGAPGRKAFNASGQVFCLRAKRSCPYGPSFPSVHEPRAPVPAGRLRGGWA